LRSKRFEDDKSGASVLSSDFEDRKEMVSQQNLKRVLPSDED
jgi:hypothetical protein